MKKILSIFVVLIAISSAVSARRMDKPEEASAMAVTESGSLVKLFYKGVKDCTVKVTIIPATVRCARRSTPWPRCATTATP